MAYRDKQFYSHLLFWLIVIAILFRYLVKFVGIEVHIPYVDRTIEVIFGIIGAIMKNLANFLGGWAG